MSWLAGQRAGAIELLDGCSMIFDGDGKHMNFDASALYLPQ